MSDPTSDPRWLDDDEQELWRLYVEVSQRLWSRLGRELNDETGISMAEYETLVKLSEAPNHRLRMSELAARTTQSRSRLTHTVARMERAGMVVRAPCEDDGRGVQATLTDTGMKLLRSAAPLHVTSVREHFFDHIDPADVPRLTPMLSTMADHLRAIDPNKVPFDPPPMRQTSQG